PCSNSLRSARPLFTASTVSLSSFFAFSISSLFRGSSSNLKIYEPIFKGSTFLLFSKNTSYFPKLFGVIACILDDIRNLTILTLRINLKYF
ncbi:GSCOCG00012359001-RA-CDS, partial [Cotesia congregata]